MYGVLPQEKNYKLICSHCIAQVINKLFRTTSPCYHVNHSSSAFGVSCISLSRSSRSHKNKRSAPAAYMHYSARVSPSSEYCVYRSPEDTHSNALITSEEDPTAKVNKSAQEDYGYYSDRKVRPKRF